MVDSGTPHNGRPGTDPIAAALNVAGEADGGLERAWNLLHFCAQAANLVHIVMKPADTAELDRHQRYLRRLEKEQEPDMEEVGRAVPAAIAVVRRVIADCGITADDLHFLKKLEGYDED